MPGPVGILYTGHAMEVLRSMVVDRSVQCVVTSPPYWGLRDYSICPCRVGRVQHDSSTLVGSQAGTPDPDCLKCAGTGRLSGMDHVWGGDPHCAHAWTEIRTPGMSGGPSPKQDSNAGSRFSGSTCSTCSAWYGGLGMEPTPEMYINHLVSVFRQVRRVLRDDGTLWLNLGDSYAGSGKSRGGGGGGPASTKQKTNVGAYFEGSHVPPLTPHGYKNKDLIGIPWMAAFALRADGWWLRQDIIYSKANPMPESILDRCTKSHEYIFLLTKSKHYYFDADAIKEDAAYAGRRIKLGKKSFSKGQAAGAGISPSGNGLADEITVAGKRNKRSVWHVASKPFVGAHFATYNPGIVLPSILAGSRPGDIILDPFSGAATVGLIALQNGREYTGIDNNPSYTEMARKRLISSGLDAEIV